MDKSTLLVTSAALTLALCAGAVGAKAECYAPAPPNSGTADCVTVQGYKDTNGNAQAVDSAHPLPTNQTVNVNLVASGFPTTSTSGSVVSGSVWQNILTQNAARAGCLVTNTSSATGTVEQVSFTTSGLAVSGASVFLAQYQSVSCAVGAFGVRTDAISITSTASGAAATFSVLSN